jgi:hypothetical protein
MKIASVGDVKARLSAYLKESLAGPVILTRNGGGYPRVTGLRNVPSWSSA